MSRDWPLLVALVTLAGGVACGPPVSGATAEQLWTENCARCHGDDGNGVAAMRGLDPGVDLRRSLMVRDGVRGLIFQRIAYGYGSMPGFSHKLPRGDVEMLVRYVTELERK